MNGSNYKNLRLSSTTAAGSSVRIRQVQSMVRDFGPDFGPGFQNDGKSSPDFQTSKMP